jgi:hypothetical protein
MNDEQRIKLNAQIGRRVMCWADRPDSEWPNWAGDMTLAWQVVDKVRTEWGWSFSVGPPYALRHGHMYRAPERPAIYSFSRDPEEGHAAPIWDDGPAATICRLALAVAAEMYGDAGEDALSDLSWDQLLDQGLCWRCRVPFSDSTCEVCAACLIAIQCGACGDVVRACDDLVCPNCGNEEEGP